MPIYISKNRFFPLILIMSISWIVFVVFLAIHYEMYPKVLIGGLKILIAWYILLVAVYFFIIAIIKSVRICRVMWKVSDK